MATCGEKSADWQRVKSLVQGMFGASLTFAAEMPSTQMPAKVAARAGAPHGAVFVTDFQSAGRGRRDRTWHGIPGRDLTFSVVLRPAVPTGAAHLLNFAAALAVARVLKQYAGIDRSVVSIKWPNDILVDERKICGIICESAGTAERLDYAVLGIGLNVNRGRDELPDTDTPDRPRPTSLRNETGRTYDLPELLARVLMELEDLTPLIEDESGCETLLREYREECGTIGRTVRVLTEDAEFKGVAWGIETDGSLVLDVGFEKKRFQACDVIHARQSHEKT